ncbi:MAG: VTC domain-containing protein [Solirubrobacteraceae bacterium]
MNTLERLDNVSLAELEASVPLRVREDRKHVLDAVTLQRLYELLAPTHAALEIGGRRAFTYDSVYFDTEELLTARAHVQRRRRRFKCRSRLYVESGTCAFELKVKGARGETVKHRMPYDTADHGALTPDARAFVAEHVDQTPDLVPVLRTTYTRTTLVGPAERVTIDVELSFGAARLRDGWAIVETKSVRGAGVADGELRRLGSRPVSLSKYVLGTGLTRMPNPPNDSRQIARKYFSRA